MIEILWKCWVISMNFYMYIWFTSLLENISAYHNELNTNIQLSHLLCILDKGKYVRFIFHKQSNDLLVVKKKNFLFFGRKCSHVIYLYCYWIYRYSVTYCYNINFDTIQSLYLIFGTGYYIRYELFHALDIIVIRYSVTIHRKYYP